MLRESKGVIAKDNGDPPERVHYLERVIDGKAVQCVLISPGGNVDARMTPTVVRSICARLGIDPAFFGFTIG